MISFGTFAIIWPFLAIGLSVAGVLAFHRYLDRREQQRHAAE